MGAESAGAELSPLLPPGASLSAGRPLTEPERVLARQVFEDSLDLNAVTISRDHVLALASATSICNGIHLRSDLGHFEGDSTALRPQAQATLVHELVHCWQYQHGGVAYMGNSVLHQGLAILRGGGRGGAYDWRQAVGQGRTWERLNPEQQAQCIEDWWTARRSGFRVHPAQEAAMAALRRGQGAPRRSLAAAAVGLCLGAAMGVLFGSLVSARGAWLGAALLGALGAWALGLARPFRRARRAADRPG